MTIQGCNEVVATEQKVRFLSSPQAYADQPAVKVIETHMSWVFIAGERVYKFKKPVRYPFLDFSTLDRRRRYCADELRLNRRLAPAVYRRLVPLRLSRVSGLTLADDGEPVEWLLEMERLPDADMLDRRLLAGNLTTDAIIKLGDALGRFYAGARPQRRDASAYLNHLLTETTVNRQLLTRAECPVPRARSEQLLGRVEALVTEFAPAIAARAANGWIVEGHGDLRPEHVCLTTPPQIIDCLEFDRNMRLLDPYDEVNYLGLECEFLGASWVRPVLLDIVDGYLGRQPEPRLLATYGAFRAMLRARICIAHLLDPVPMQAERWPGEAAHYLDLAECECVKAGG
ncbi:MAG: hypothetical protein EOP24_14650 [Hyphomicrobiales bacterium]|nr:MAG: hypothetical protein EOP24_14650 [Hyphomicrobiales bacterium]